MRKFISDQFETKIKELFSDKPEVCRFLLNHERRGLVIENLNTEIGKLEYIQIRLDLALLKSVINDFIVMFARAAIKKAEQDLLTYSERMRQEREYQAQQDLTKELEKTCEQSTTVIDSLDTDSK